MSSDSSSNIFEEASKKLGKKKKKETKIPPKISPIQETSLPSEPIADSEVKKIIKRVREMDEDLQKKMDRLCQISGMSRSEVTNYIENQSNFHPEQWEAIKLKQRELEAQFQSTVGMDLDVKKKKAIKQKKRAAKERHGKSLGSRKGWIDMR